ncbi:MAG: ATPase, T2SS/T4P/T4SS family [bacterium]
METLVKEDFNIGKMLLEYNFITEEQLKKVETKSQESNKKISEVLTESGYVTEGAINYVLSSKLDLPYVHVSYEIVDPAVVKCIPKDILQRYKMVPIIRTDNEINLVMADPTDLKAIEEAKNITGCEIKISIGLSSEILEIINQVFGKEVLPVKEIEAKPEEEILKDTSGVAFVYYQLTQAMKEDATNIYIEPMANDVRIRYRRRDGTLFEKEKVPLTIYPSILSRIKLIANLQTQKEGIPQKSNIHTKIGDKELYLNISTLSTINGEVCVIKILEEQKSCLELEKLGVEATILPCVKEAIKSASGMVIVTGPSSSGRTTTTYALLKEIDSTRNRIITIEDSVSYKDEGFTQIELTREQDSLSSLKIAINQSSDVVMIEDMNQDEIIKVCFNGALAGRLILGQMYHSYAFEVVDRLLRIGIPSSTIASSLLLIIAQRRIQLLCENCKEPYPPPEKLKLSVSTLYRAKGCPKCNQSGYQGSTYIYEVLIINDKLKRLFGNNESLEKIKEVSTQEGFISLKENGMKKVISGVTSLEEVMSKISLYEEVA